MLMSLNRYWDRTLIEYTSSQDKTMLGRYKESDSRENCKIFIDI